MSNPNPNLTPNPTPTPTPNQVYQLASTGFTPVTDPETTLGSIGLSGRVMVNISERS